MYLNFLIIFVVFSVCKFLNGCRQAPQELNHICYKNTFLAVGSKHTYMEENHYTDANSWSDNHEVHHILRNPQFRCRAISLCSDTTRKIQ